MADEAQATPEGQQFNPEPGTPGSTEQIKVEGLGEQPAAPATPAATPEPQADPYAAITEKYGGDISGVAKALSNQQTLTNKGNVEIADLKAQIQTLSDAVVPKDTPEPSDMGAQLLDDPNAFAQALTAKIEASFDKKREAETEASAKVHNDGLVLGRSKEILLEAATAAGDKAGAERYADVNYTPTKSELEAADPIVKAEMAWITQELAPDLTTYRYNPKAFQMAKMGMDPDKFAKAQQKVGTDRTLQQIHEAAPVARILSPSGSTSEVVHDLSKLETVEDGERAGRAMSDADMKATLDQMK